ncbi:MAG: phospho-N-acetylmuramoyl-pentapeptide-transferase [Cyanobacteriota bacterium]|jgi:phospho-N-acetylmuramoyl-pentapeptide-transferase
MFYWIGEKLEFLFGPLRLLESRSFLLIMGLYVGFMVTFFLLPRVLAFLPCDRGREFAGQAAVAKGKPTGSGIVFIPIFLATAILVVPFSPVVFAVAILTLGTCVAGFLDDSARTAWGEYLKGFIDLFVSLCASLVIGMTVGTEMWFPFMSHGIVVPLAVYVFIGTILIWITINSTNCSDGVDGLSGTLSIIALVSLGATLYLVIGNSVVARYLLIPFVSSGAEWAIFAFSLTGVLAAYLWYNAYPSKVLMGDAGSRSIGFVLGVLVLVSGNPFLVLAIATVLLVNGGTGLVKVALLRFLRIKIFHNTRFPLHDHVRATRNWSNAQILLKFSIIQVMIILGIIGVFLKIR